MFPGSDRWYPLGYHGATARRARYDCPRHGSDEARDHGHLGPAARDHRPRAARGAAARARCATCSPASTSASRSTATQLGDAGFEPGDLTSLDDLAGLPFTEKTDFRDNYPYGLFAVPMSEVVEIHSSSGTTGKAVVGGYTQGRPRDLDRAGVPARRRRRRARRRRRPDRLRLRHVHRRLRPALRAAARRRRPCCPSAPATPRARSSS